MNEELPKIFNRRADDIKTTVTYGGENLDIVIEPEGKKFDNGKPRWSLLPEKTIGVIMSVLELGAVKYGEHNFKKVNNAKERYYNAMMRHIDAWWNGEKLDEESGKSHLAHAACCILFLLWFEINNKFDDNSSTK